jgi:hypothetical protein
MEPSDYIIRDLDPADAGEARQAAAVLAEALPNA